MATRVNLDGWNVHVEAIQIPATKDTEEQEGHRLVFTEVEPDTGNVIIFGFPQRVSEYLVEELTKP